MVIYDVPELKRENRTVDIVKRVGVIGAKNILLKNYPMKHPATIFNAGLLIEGEALTFYSRMVVGYYSRPYSSAIMRFQVPIEDLDGDVSKNTYEGELIITPDFDNGYDVWGTEDPRITVVNGKKVIVYCGLTRNFHNPAVKFFKNLPVGAVYEKGEWKKIGVFKLEGAKITGDKDAFLVDMNGLKFFHRPTMEYNGKLRDFCVISKPPEDALNSPEFREIETQDGFVPIDGEKFEYKIGWGTPPLRVSKNEYLLLLHGVDMDAIYRAFAALMDGDGRITAVTPYYIMEPREIYEKYGDRPHVVFPTGIGLLDDDVIIAYGAADSFIGIGRVDLSEIMSILDSNRV